MDSNEIREIFLEFFKSQGHEKMPPSSLISSDPTTLFTTAGMQQFKKFYLDPKKAPANRVATIQPVLRTSDIDEVGDASHLTFFEMLGNFSFGYPSKNDSYYKKDAIKWAWEFLTDEKWLGIDKKRISATYFGGDRELPADNESLKILQNFDDLKIKPQGFDDNFWSLGTEGSPGGPTVEFYLDDIEVWNLVFNEYIFQNGRYELSKTKGVDTGMGLERLAMIMQGKKDVYETDLFAPIIEKIERISGKKYQENKKEFRIIADHIKAAVFLLEEGIQPSNKDQGYIVRRLVRRAIVKGQQLGIDKDFTTQLAEDMFEIYKSCHPKLDLCHPELDSGSRLIKSELEKEETKFRKTLRKGLKEFQRRIIGGFGSQAFGSPPLKLKDYPIDGKKLFDLYQTYGFPLELSLELAKEKGIKLKKTAIEDFNKNFSKHQQISRAGAEKKFSGGLAGTGDQETKYHTATHLLHASLRQILGEQVGQKGSNITAERLRFDFSYPDKMTLEQIEKVENLVNAKIQENLPVKMEEMTVKEAKKSGALGFFEHKYGDKVKVYSIGNFSIEICGGPHVKNTSELGRFKIIKEESSSQGVRRIKAVLE